MPVKKPLNMDSDSDSETTVEDKKNIKKNIKQNVKKVESSSEDSDSESDDVTRDSVRTSSREHHLQTEFTEKVRKYVYTDDLMRKISLEHRENMATLKEDKQELEKHIIRYLDTVDQDIINIPGSGKITKYESTTRKAINKELIVQSIFEQLKKEKLIKNDEEGKALAIATFELMDGKRAKQVKMCLKRTVEKKKKNDKN